MIGSFLRESVILVAFYSVLLSGEDILQNCRPAPGLPEELNKWFASVQRHKSDFELIRYAAQKFGKYDIGLRDFKKEAKREFKPKYLVDLNENDEESFSEERPEHDIYPYMYRRGVIEPIAEMVEPISVDRKQKLRLRRDSAEANKIIKQNNVQVELKAKNGNVFRTADKFPDRYKNEPRNDINKRDIRIDVYSDGKLIKQSNSQDNKPIVLNIQSDDKFAAINQNDPKSDSQAKRNDISLNTYPTESVPEKKNPEESQEEVNSNFKNLFNVNEHLNTDTNVHYQNPMIYHVSLPDINAFLKSTSKEDIKKLMTPIQSTWQYNFNENSLQDMSPYWTPTEKSMMQKGLEVAQKIVNLPYRTSPSSVDKNGFERVKSIVVNEGKDRIDNKMQLIVQNAPHRVLVDRYAQDSQENEYPSLEGPALQKKIIDSNAMIRRPSESQLANQYNSKTNENNNEENQQFINFSPQKQMIQSYEPLYQVKDTDLSNHNYNRLANQQSNYLLQDENRAADNQHRYCSGNGCKEDVEIPIGNSDNENEDIIYMPNNFIGVGKKRPSSSSEVENLHRKKRDFLLTAHVQPQMQDVLNLNNPKETNNIETEQRNQADVEIPYYEARNESFENFNSGQLPVNNYENMQGNDLANVLTPQDKMFAPEATSVGIDPNIPFSNPNETSIANSIPQVKEGAKNENSENPPQENSETKHEKTEYEEPNDETYDEDNDDTTSSNPAVLIIINPDNNEMKEEDEPKLEITTKTNSEKQWSAEDLQTENHFKTEHMNEQNNKNMNGHNQCNQLPLKKIENIQEHVETNRVITKIETITIENIASKNSNGNQSPTDNGNGSPEHSFSPHKYKNSLHKHSIKFNSNDNSIDPNETYLRKVSQKRLKLPSNENIRILKPRKIITITKRKHHRKRMKKPQRHKQPNWGFNGIKNYIANENAFIDNPGKDSDSIPAFVGRQLKSVDYIYDANLGYPDLEEVIHKESNRRQHSFQKRKISVSTTNSILHKDSAEGDYGEEEESENGKQKKEEYKIVKKTKNDFANPVTNESETEEEYDEEQYDEDVPQDMNIKDKSKLNSKNNERETETFGRHLHPKSKGTTRKSEKKNTSKKQETKKKLTRSVNMEIPKIAKRDGHKQRIIPRRKFLRNSEFQQWPKFMRNDQENEDILHKRSVATTGQSVKTNSFPLSTNSFFITSRATKMSTVNENLNKGVENRAAFVTDDDSNALKLTTAIEIGTINLPDVSLNLDSDEKLVDTLMPISVSIEPSGDNFTMCTIADTNFTNLDSTSTVECTEPQVVTNVCEDNAEFFNRTQIPITSVLPLVSESENSYGEMYEPFENLDPIISGEIPFKLLDHMFSQLTHANHLERFRKGLKRTYKKDALDNILDTSNLESKKIIAEMTKLLSKLQISTNCQALHPRLKHYLKLITRAKTDTVLRKTKEMEAKLLDDSQNRNEKKNFVFTSSELSDNLEDKASVLQGLLSKYKSLPDQCKPRALPVKEYIERHLGMLNNMLAEDDNKATSDNSIIELNQDNNSALGPVKLRSLDKTTYEFETETKSIKSAVDQELEKLGLGENKYKLNIDLDELMAQNRHRKDTVKSEGKQEKRTHGTGIKKRHTENYEKLLNAVAKEKMRKIRDTRLGEMYGKFNNDLDSKDEHLKRDVTGFESPLVYSF